MVESKLGLVWPSNILSDQCACPETDIVQLYYNYGYDGTAGPHFDGDSFEYLYNSQRERNEEKEEKES